MKYRATYDAKTQKMRIFVDDLPANQYEFAKIIRASKEWELKLRYHKTGISYSNASSFKINSTLAELKTDLDALDATRYKELSFTATAN